ncbi:N-6 DNA methylase, partial [Candidatus Bathyarchaeota archaeon]|nr:N-6 DNA methylase [Candidatus Bathyarchaeota archaeon]
NMSDARSKWMIPLFKELGFDPGFIKEEIVVDGDDKLRFRLSHRGWISAKAPIMHMVAPAQDLEEASDGTEGEVVRRGRSRSPHDELQAYLNVTKGSKWGIVTNGILLRILREYYHTTTKGYVEFDIENIFRERGFTDFRAMYRMAHASRFLLDKDDLCPLEQFYRESVAAGVTVGENLRRNVKKAIEALGNGFLTTELAKKMTEDEEFCRAYYSELLRVVYRLLFLLFAEQRAMLPTRDSLYAEEYSITRLREMAETRQGKDDHFDLWEGLNVTFNMLKKGCSPLKVFGYNGSLFDESELPILSPLSCKNSDILETIRDLTLVEEERVLKRINYLDLGVSEIGSIYESLLDFTPRVFERDQEVEKQKVPANTFFLDPRGVGRRATGSYYTNPRLIDELIKGALKPVVGNKLASTPDTEKALLSIKVCDPACGSGAFLIAANNYLARELAKLRTSQAEPPEREVKKATRDILQHCVYGVDLNPMAVELAKVSLWINSCVEDMPLNFLDHHIKCGNSIIGATANLLQKGIPNEAFTAVNTDEKNVAKEIMFQNSLERGQKLILEFTPAEQTRQANEYSLLDELTEKSPNDVEEKKKRFGVLVHSESWKVQKLIADSWTAAFFWSLNKESPRPPTQGTLRLMQTSGGKGISQKTLKLIEELSEKYQFFCWKIEFPDVFKDDKAGFDCVIGNPPWDIVELNEDEFFCKYVDEDTSDMSKNEKRAIYERLLAEDRIMKLYTRSKQKIDKLNNFIKLTYKYQKVERSRGFPPKNNTYRIFIERFYDLTNERGYCGMITPLGIQGDEGCVSLKKHMLFPKTQLSAVFGFRENNDYFSVKQPFAIFSFAKGKETKEVLFFSGLKNLDEIENRTAIPVKVELIEKLSTELIFSEFTTCIDFAVTEKLYMHPTLDNVIDENLMGIQFGPEEINETRSSQYFSKDPTQVPLLKGDSIQAYLKPNFSRYVQRDHFLQKSAYNCPDCYRLIWGDIRNINMSKRLCFTLAEPNQAIGNSLNFIIHKSGKKEELKYLCALLNSYVVEYRFRKISSNNHVNKRLIKDMPICTSSIGSEKYFEIVRLVDHLREAGCASGSPEYLEIVAKINSLVAHLFSLTKEELCYVMDSFSLLREQEIKSHGKFITKSLIVAEYESLGEVNK